VESILLIFGLVFGSTYAIGTVLTRPYIRHHERNTALSPQLQSRKVATIGSRRI